jgi:hypothetical protein
MYFMVPPGQSSVRAMPDKLSGIGGTGMAEAVGRRGAGGVHAATTDSISAVQVPNGGCRTKTEFGTYNVD